MKKTIYIGLGLFLLAVVAVGYSMNKPKPQTTQMETTTELSPANSPTIKLISLAEIGEHSTAESCWFAIEGKVYDVSPMIADKKHPGGAAILEGCGKDATVLFNTRPMGTNTPHSDKAKSFLPNYYIGELDQTK